MRRPIITAATLLGAVILVASACGGSTPASVGLGLSAQAPATTSTTAAPTTPTTSAAASTCVDDTATKMGNATASLRPAGPLPAPGSTMTGFMGVIQQRGRLVVGVDQNTYLFGFVNPATGTFEGFDIDMLRQVAEAIFGPTNVDAHIQFKSITSAERIPEVQSGDVDIVADTMTVNCARDQLVDFSTEYYHAGQKVLVPVNSGITSLNQLGGKKVCAAAGSTSIETIANWPSHPIPLTVANWTDCLVDLQQQTVSAISTDDTILAGLARQDPNVAVVGPDITAEPYGMAISNKNPEFVQFVNAVLAQMRVNGTWTQIYNKWLSGLGPAPAPPAALYKD
jgi:polar amino acid transport system substrate-binding protein